MSSIITYTPATLKKYQTFEWRGKVSEFGARHALKMLRPICYECTAEFPAPPKWWENCQHKPYQSLRPKKINKPVYVQDEDGDFVLDEEATARGKVDKMILVPNVTEVILHPQLNDGRGPEKMRILKGFITMIEGGLAPMCEAFGCGRAWPTFDAGKYGKFCGEAHARACANKEDEVITIAFIDRNVSDAQTKRAMREQDRQVDL